jgi:Uma2 family endonuclease
MIATTNREPLFMTETEYLAFEEKSETKHEYVKGMVLAMAGAGWNHNIINGNTQTSLNSQLVDSPCVVVSRDMRLKVESRSVSFRYPDTMVVCGDPQFVHNRPDTITNPTLLIEVLSASTALEDRNAKLDEYTHIPGLQEYILISPDEPRVERFKRHGANEWLYTAVMGLDQSLEVSSIDCTLALAKIYEKINWNQTATVSHELNET